jgi:hypothetical protein
VMVVTEDDSTGCSDIDHPNIGRYGIEGPWVAFPATEKR